MLLQKIANDAFLGEDEIIAFVHEACAGLDLDGKRVLFIIPDSTRSMPMPLMFRALFDALFDAFGCRQRLTLTQR